MSKTDFITENKPFKRGIRFLENKQNIHKMGLTKTKAVDPTASVKNKV